MLRNRIYKTVLAWLVCLALLAGCAAQPASESAASVSVPASEAPAPAAAEQPAPAAPAYDYAAGRKARQQETPMGEEGTWTILLYLCGSDLETNRLSASFNLLQIMKIVPQEHVNIIVQTGGAEAWGSSAAENAAAYMDWFDLDSIPTSVVDPTVLQRYRVTNELVLLDEQPLVSMADPNTLYDFLSWGVENYPAEKMGVIVWDHGGTGVIGACQDQLFGDIMQTFQIAHAFDRVFDEMTDRFEFIGFDACLMATIEVANSFVPHARYLYASEETEPSLGWNYETLVGELNSRPQVSGAELGTAVFDGTFDLYRTIELSDNITLSVTDLEKVDPLLAAMDELALELERGFTDPAYLAQVSRAAAAAENYYKEWQLDIGDFADRLASIAPVQAEQVKTALSDAIVYMVNGSAHAFSNGLSVYYPVKSDYAGLLGNYALNYSSPGYYAYVNELHLRMLKQKGYGQPLVDITQPPAFGDEGQYVMQIDPATLDYISEIGFMLFEAPEGNESCYFLGYDDDVLIDYTTGLVEDHFSSGWAHLDGEPLMVMLHSGNESYKIYHSPILLNGQRTYLLLKVSADESDRNGAGYEILGTFDGTDPYTQMGSRITRPLQAGDTVVPLYGVLPLEAVTMEEDAAPEEYLDENGELVLTPGPTMMIREDSTVERLPLKAARYLYQYTVVDVYGQEQTFVPVVFEVGEEGGVTHPEA